MSSNAPPTLSSVHRAVPLVLLHAFPMNRHMWDKCSTIFSAERRVFTPEAPGFGDAPAANAFTLDACADAVANLLDQHAIPKAVVCGVSMGGYIAFALWRRHQHRVAGLILADTRADADSPETIAKRASQTDRIRREGPDPLANDLFAAMIGPSTHHRIKDIDDRAFRNASPITSEAMIAALGALAGRTDSTSILSTINIPTLIIVGSEDTVTPPALSESIHAQIPQSQYCIISGAGHLTPIEHSEKFTELVQSFLHTHFPRP